MKKMMICPSAGSCSGDKGCSHRGPHLKIGSCGAKCHHGQCCCVPVVEEKPKKTTKKFLITVTVEEVA